MTKRPMDKMVWTEEAMQFCPYKLSGNPPNIKWMAKRLRDGDLFLDVGSSVGALCIATLLEVPGSRCVAFEPQTRSADALEGLAEVNGLSKHIELRREAVSSSIGEAVLKFPDERSISGWGSIADKPDFFQAANKKVVSSTEPCKVTTLDSWWNEAGRPDVRLVKCDTQGAEVDVLIGGAELFATVPYLFIEIHGPTLAEHGRDKASLLRHLDGLGYDWHQHRVNLRCEKRKA
jgi:FkbM family methyltransferase